MSGEKHESKTKARRRAIGVSNIESESKSDNQRNCISCMYAAVLGFPSMCSRSPHRIAIYVGPWVCGILIHAAWGIYECVASDPAWDAVGATDVPQTNEIIVVYSATGASWGAALM